MLVHMAPGLLHGCMVFSAGTHLDCLLPLQIKGLLLTLARDSCLSALSSLQDRIRMLQERPLELDNFMAYQASRPALGGVFCSAPTC